MPISIIHKANGAISKKNVLEMPQSRARDQFSRTQNNSRSTTFFAVIPQPRGSEASFVAFLKDSIGHRCSAPGIGVGLLD
jgi:hypothetical protein